MPIPWPRRSIASARSAVGAVTGLLVSFLVLPSRAVRQIRASAAKLLELIAEAFTELLAGLTRGRDNDALHRIQDGIGTAMVGMNAIGAEAERERSARLSGGPDTGPLLRTILRLRHDVVMIGRATVVPLPVEVQMRLAAPLAEVSDRDRALPESAAAALREGAGAPPIHPVHVALQHYAEAVAAVRQDGLIRGQPGDTAERFFALGFSLEQMHQNLCDLDRVVGEWSESRGRIGRCAWRSELPLRQALALHAPDQEIDAVLAEERLVLEHEGRHAPMARGRVVLFVLRDHLLVAIRIGADRRIHRGEIEARLLGGAREMIALVPACHRAVPQHARDRVSECERAAFELRHRA